MEGGRVIRIPGMVRRVINTQGMMVRRVKSIQGTVRRVRSIQRMVGELEQTGNCDEVQEHTWKGGRVGSLQGMVRRVRSTGNGGSVRRIIQGMVMSARSIKKIVGVRSMHGTVGVLEW
jgi:hypothetical protein